MTDAHGLKELARAAKVFGLTDQPSLGMACQKILNTADGEKRPFTDEETRTVCAEAGTKRLDVERLQANAVTIVNAAKACLAKERPQLLEPGGALFPASRAEACWRDCMDFFRVIVYAVACGQAKFTDPKGMCALRELYARMGVPTDGLTIALEQLKHLSREQTVEPDSLATLTEAFDHLMNELNISAVKS